MKSADEEALPQLHESWIDDKKLDEDDLDKELLESFRDKFATGELVGVRLPVTVVKKTGRETKEVQTCVSLFIKQPDALSKGLDLYLRGGLTLPEEAKFGQRKALGALIASDEGIADFLGNAENAAHTKWDAKAEKLHKNYLTPRNTLTAIRHSVVNFFDMLAQAVDEEDEHALMEFFWEEVPGQKHAPKKTGQTQNDIEKPPAPNPKPCTINRIENGFSLSPGKDIEHFPMPLKLRIRACYDTCAGNPFKKFSPLDFDFRKKNNLNIRIKGISRQPADRYANMIEMEITDPDFYFQAKGFDPNRDLLLKVNTVEE